MSKLWYQKPAGIWEEALPLGNGRLGAMVYGGVEKEMLQMNEESIWSGGKKERINPDAYENLPKIRKMIEEGQISKAQELMSVAMTGCPNSMNPYQTLGSLVLYFRHPEMKLEAPVSPEMVTILEDGGKADYERSLDLSTSISRVQYTVGGNLYEREYFISKPADCFVAHMKASGEGSISFQLRIDRWYFFRGVKKTATEDGVVMYGNLGQDGFCFQSMVRGKVIGGSLKVLGETLVVENAKEVFLYFTADTDYHHKELLAQKKQGRLTEDQVLEQLEKQSLETLERAMNTDYETLRAEHIQDFQSLYGRVSLSLEKDPALEALPTDVRLERLHQEGTKDIGLAEVLFDYGRYLTVTGSREGGLPTTLQGLWNQDFVPAWGGKYTININTEMNYWPTESCNLSECHLPLFDLIETMKESGRENARRMYGCRGFMAHHNTDIHGDCAPQDLWYPATYWPMGAAWLCTHIWTHYEYTCDKAFLAEKLPTLLEAALYFVDALQPYKEYYVTNPSSSPENTYILPNGDKGSVCMGPTMDNQILYDLFTICLDGAEIVREAIGAGEIKASEDCKGLDYINIPDLDDVEALIVAIREKRAQLPPTRIGSDGRIMEWLEEYQEEEPGHRHVSQLYGLYPSNQITVDMTPDLARAARKTLEMRLSHGGGHTGWSRAWIMNHYAKLWDGEKANENIEKMLIQSTYPNMFDKHPPFQIDGNYGASAAIAQMLVQSSQGRVVVLPALPAAWSKGSVSGLKTVGNGEISLEWENGSLTHLRFLAHAPFHGVLKYQENSYQLSLEKGQCFEL